MAIPKIDEENISEAMKYIDKHGVPEKNKSTQYLLVTEEGKEYPPKYVIAVASYLRNGGKIATDSFHGTEARKYLETKGYEIVYKQEKYELTITADKVISTDNRFSIDNLGLGGNYKPIDVYFVAKEGEIIRRKYNKGEKRSTNQTLPRLACQIYENQLNDMSAWDKKNFPICKYTPEGETICGIFPTVNEFLKYKNSMEHLTYQRENGPQFVMYSWNIFSTLIFVQECMRRFGKDGDKFVLIYRDKTEQERNLAANQRAVEAEEKQTAEGCKNPYSKLLLESKNIIFRGAPGTGKSFIAKEIAADIISNGYTDKYTDLTEEQKKQVEFVQFHPGYDYSDFVEGLRPKMNEDGSMGFELQDGIFKKFVDKARKNLEDSKKTKELVGLEVLAKVAMAEFLANVEFEKDEFETIKGSKFTISNVNDKHIFISIPENANINKLSLNIRDIQKMLESDIVFEKVSDITHFFGKQFATQAYSYDFALYKAIKAYGDLREKLLAVPEKQKKYIFIIDEINRGEISKILGELFFSIDPGYRGKAGEVATQYSNMHDNPNEKFYIPENVYIIGTMNDIDRSVDSFDFAMRRRFRFIEISAESTQDMLDTLNDEELKKEAIKRMDRLNEEIVKVPDLNENYQIGASYFLKLKNLKFGELWTDYLQPLLQEYVRGLSEEEECMKRFERAYGFGTLVEENTDEIS